MDFEIFEILILFYLVILTGYTIILMNRIDKIFKNAREDTNPLNDYVPPCKHMTKRRLRADEG